MPQIVTKEVFVKVPVAQAWQALTDKDQMKEWYFNIPDFELKEGNVFHFNEGGEAPKFLHRCELLSIIPESQLTHTWTHPSHSKGSSTVTWNFTPEGDGTRIRLTHEDLENFADAGPEFAAANYDMGWEGIVKSSLKNYLYGIRKLKLTTTIQAPSSKVWQVLWGDDTYTQWCSPFSEGTQMKGELKNGGRVHFLAANGDGMYSDVIFCQEPSFVLFRHIGMVENGQEMPVNEAGEQWTGSFEQYRLTEKEGATTLYTEVDVMPAHHEFFSKAFPEALAIVKGLSEA